MLASGRTTTTGERLPACAGPSRGPAGPMRAIVGFALAAGLMLSGQETLAETHPQSRRSGAAKSTRPVPKSARPAQGSKVDRAKARPGLRLQPVTAGPRAAVPHVPPVPPGRPAATPKPAPKSPGEPAKTGVAVPWWGTIAALGAPPKPADMFAKFIADLWPAAQARGVSRATFEAAFKGVTFDPATDRLTRVEQPEFAVPIWQYLASVLAPAQVDIGKRKAQTWVKTLARIESDFGVPREIVVAVWGIESGFGAGSGKVSTIRALATLAFKGYRGELFKDELLNALQILQAGDVPGQRMLGSWAGAMGQTQFMPSSFLKYGVDYDGDGHRDIWNDVPDALASTANFLKSYGWDSNLPWGFEVVLPKDFDASHNEETTLAPFRRWRERGVTRRAGVALPVEGEASLLIPAGLQGPAFLVTPNFKVIKAYNNSTAYALAVALLGERIAARPPVGTPWPVNQKQLNVAQTVELQTRLKARGFDVGEADGKIGERLRDAILAYEAKTGKPQTGVADQNLLDGMRAAH